MSPAQPVSHLVLVLLVIVGMTVPAAAVTGGGHASDVGSAGVASMAAQAENNSSVTVTVGQQLSTVISVSSDDVQTAFGDTGFEVTYEREDEEGKAKAIADRADDLRLRAADIREDYLDATAEYEAGEINRSEYAQRLATLNARASNLLASYEVLQQRAAVVSGLELRAAGANLSSLDAALRSLSSVTGPGSSALLEQYLGDADGEIKLETAGGLTVEIEREDGEASREFERARDDDMNITVRHAAAYRTARDALSPPESGHWVLTESKVKRHEGAFEFEFVLAGSQRLTGEAEVRVDGSTGDIYRLEQETEPRGDDDDERDEDEDGLTLLVVEGTPEPNATITLRVLADGAPAEGVPVELNDRDVGTTDANGTVVVTLPEAGDAELTAELGDADGEVEFEFDHRHEHETAAVFERLDVSASLDGDAVTVAVRFDGDAVPNATVYANDERVGKTAADGTVSFAFDADATDELELEIVKGRFEAELSYEVQAGTLVLTEAEHEADDDSHRDDADADDDEDRSLEIVVIDGTAEPGATVTIQVSAGGEPVEGATVALNGDVVGTTDADGSLDVTLPDDDDADIRAEHGDADGRLEFEDEDEDG